MNAFDIALIVVIAAAVIFALIRIRRSRKRGCSCCSGDCTSCGTDCSSKK